MQYIAADGDSQAGYVALRTADCQRIKQRLCRVLMRAVTGVDHGARDFLRQQRRRACRTMPDDQDVRMHGVQRHCRVDQRFALLDRRIAHRHVHHIGAQALAGEFERRLRARGGFEKQIDLGAAAQGWLFFIRLPRDSHSRIGAIQQKFNIEPRQPLDAEQMPVWKDGMHVGFCHRKSGL